MASLDSRFQIPDSSRRGFTLLELVVFLGIFVVVIIGFITTFVAITRIQVRQSASAEVAAQSQFLLQTLQYYIERASFVDMTPGMTGATLALRTSSSTEGDPLYIYYEEGRVFIDRGNGQPIEALTSDRVTITDLSFTRNSNPPAHDSVSISFAMETNTTNITRRFAHAIRTGIVRVSAATFDTSVEPGTSNLNLGSASGAWRSINSTIYFSGANVGIGYSSPTVPLVVAGGDVHLRTAASGLVLTAPNGTTCIRLTATNAGALQTATTTCP